MSTVVETTGPTVMFATMWAVKMLNFFGLSDIILQYRKNSHSKFSQTITSKQWRSTQRTDEMDCRTRSVAHSSFPR